MEGIMIIKLRELEKKDALYMLEWMHDEDIQKCFQKNMSDMQLKDAEKFCEDMKIPENLDNGTNLHYAIVDDRDEYLGTVSLKDINLNNKTAEYAIVTRKKVHGKGIAYRATQLVLNKAFNEFGLHRVYLNVIADNVAAIRLYERCGFVFEGEFRDHLCKEGIYMNWKWYGLLSNEYNGLISL